MDSNWYWRRNGRQHGPVASEELLRLCRANSIIDTDEIRLGDTDEWLSAVDVKAMLVEQSAGSESASASAARAISNANRFHPLEGDGPRDV